MIPKEIELIISDIINKLSPDELNGLLDSSIEIDANHHTLTLREVVAKSLVSISREPKATRECRRHALQYAKLFLKDSAEGTTA
jgi:hypothetical protein